MKYIKKIAIIIASCMVLLACGASDDNAPGTTNRYAATVQELYEKLKASGEAVPDNIVDWIKEDIEKIGTWEYKVVPLDAGPDPGIEAILNDLGQKRWECFRIERQGAVLTLYLKRPAKSYVSTIPPRHLWKFFTPEPEK
jgi:hypothetical protein